MVSLTECLGFGGCGIVEKAAPETRIYDLRQTNGWRGRGPFAAPRPRSTRALVSSQALLQLCAGDDGSLPDQ